MENEVDWGFWIAYGTRNSAIRWSAYEFLLVFHNVPILRRFWDIARYWSNIADFNPSHLYLASPLGATPLEFRQKIFHQ